jgi:hypothetical protein
MTFLKALAVASLVFASAQASASAFTPPYHINGTPYVGTATFKASGGCKVAPRKFDDAKFGEIQDSTNAVVGVGVIDAAGNFLLAVQNTSIPTTQQVLIEDYVRDFVIFKTFLISYVGPYTLQHLASQSGCDPQLVWAVPGPSTFDERKFSPTSAELSIKQNFVGYTGFGSECVKTEKKNSCVSKKFTGSITFKGSKT